MQVVLQDHSRAGIAIPTIPLVRGMVWGLNGGLVATLVMDLFLMGSFVIAGMPPFTCFAIIGDTLASLLSIRALGINASVPLGAGAHYLIGPVIGALFGAAVLKVAWLRMDTLKKGMLSAVLFAEILSQPMLALPPVLLRMTAPETLLWFGGSFGMHLIWGAVLGAVVSLGLRKK
jgi:hypothetical protein